MKDLLEMENLPEIVRKIYDRKDRKRFDAFSAKANGVFLGAPDGRPCNFWMDEETGTILASHFDIMVTREDTVLFTSYGLIFWKDEDGKYQSRYWGIIPFIGWKAGDPVPSSELGKGTAMTRTALFRASKFMPDHEAVLSALSLFTEDDGSLV